jgi:hypothetical protein
MMHSSTPRPGRYGSFGGQFVAPVLLPVLDRLEAAFNAAWADPAFRRSFEDLLTRVVGAPAPIVDTTTRAHPQVGGRRHPNSPSTAATMPIRRSASACSRRGWG